MKIPMLLSLLWVSYPAFLGIAYFYKKKLSLETRYDEAVERKNVANDTLTNTMSDTSGRRLFMLKTAPANAFDQDGRVVCHG